MGEYRVEVGSFVTRLIKKRFTVKAQNEEEAKQKAIKKYEQSEMKISSSVDSGSPRVDRVIKVK